MQGRDLSALYLSAGAPAWRDEFFYEHPTVTSKNRIPTSHGVIRRDWKYIEWPEFDARQLFESWERPGRDPQPGLAAGARWPGAADAAAARGVAPAHALTPAVPPGPGPAPGVW